MSELSSVSRETVGVIGDIMLNSYLESPQMFVSMAFERGRVGIFSYRYDTDKVG